MDLTGARADALAAIIAWTPGLIEARFDYWERGGLPAGVGGEHVSRSRSLPLPQFDRFDAQIGNWRRQHRSLATDLITASVGLSALQAVVLTPIGLAPKEIRNGVSDDATCLYGCVRQSKKAWQIRRGLCPMHYAQWSRAGKPEINVEAELKHETA